jgi:hypothetical protein
MDDSFYFELPEIEDETAAYFAAWAGVMHWPST